MAKAGRIERALVWFEQAAAAGDGSACLAAAEALADSGRRTEAIPWFHRAAAAGDTDIADVATEWLSLLTPQRGSRQPATLGEEADDVLDYDGPDWAPANAADISYADPRAPRMGLLDAAFVESPLTHHAHERSPKLLGEVSQWAKQALRQRSTSTLLATAQRLATRGLLEEALDAAEKAAAEGEPGALYWAAQQLADRGRWSDAYSWCRRAVAAGSETAAHLAIVCLEELGRIADAQQLNRFGWTAEGGIAAPWHLLPEGPKRAQDTG
jgi:TPR repeat protein